MEVETTVVAVGKRWSDDYLEVIGPALVAHPHPGLLRVSSVGARQLVHEPVLGESWLERAPRDDRAVNAARDVCLALAHAHRYIGEHGRVAPAAIRLTDTGAKLLGFEWRHEVIEFAHDGPEVASPAYMAFLSPEEVAGAAVDARADLYALGATLWTWLVGEPPFGSVRTVPDVFRVIPEIMEAELEFPVGWASEYSAFFATALARDPAARFSNAEAMAASLADLAQSVASRSPRMGTDSGCR